ncbi:MAG TPA: glycosyltransferase family 2 protein [Anaerolineales bacterium]|jgi:glycosyltransferase involved in cell wall biosynthesis|nr:glycosyltransferase family 2 protein [Anaerolineales bacterium]
MDNKPLVSAVIVFLNAEKFIEEAITSILAQTYLNWELLLVDDGSTDRSTEIARRFAARRPTNVRYIEHTGHQNRGKGASRNLGIRNAKGKYIGFLDADDVWLPHKLEQQVAILESQPEAGVLYGNTLYWYSWTQKPEDAGRDFMPHLGVPTNTMMRPPSLLPLYLRGKVAVPCTCSILLRSSIVYEVGGFDETFVNEFNIYEDQAFYAKVCLRTPIYVVHNCWDLYRQHPGTSSAVAQHSRQEIIARSFFLNWLRSYLDNHEVKDFEVWQALVRELWRIYHPGWLPSNEPIQITTRWAKKWLLRLEERLLPLAISRWLWGRS